MESVKTAKLGNETLEIYFDEAPIDPRENDNLGKMTLFHNRYNLPNETGLDCKNFNDFETVENVLRNDHEAVIVLPVFMYDHGGLAFSTGSFNDRWDSGQVGFISASREAILKHFTPHNKPQLKRITKKMIETTREILKAEIKEYDSYSQGMVYCYRIYSNNVCPTCNHTEQKTEDSCGGFYSIEDIKDSLPQKWRGALS